MQRALRYGTYGRPSGRAISDATLDVREEPLRGTTGRWFWIAAVVTAVLAIGGVARTQSAFPTRPVHIFVLYPAGGGVDILTRTLGDVVSRQWGQAVVVENRPG